MSRREKISPEAEAVLVRVLSDRRAMDLYQAPYLAAGVLRRHAERTGRSWIVVLALAMLALGACGDNLQSAGDACSEQARTWCTRAPSAHGYAFDCESTYRGDCEPDLVSVDPESEIVCLDAIAANQDTWCVPTVCTLIWGRPTAVIHFCRD